MTCPRRRSYTQAWPDPDDSLYAVLNRTLGAAKRPGVVVWLSYLKLFFTCLAAEPRFVGTLYRGVNIKPVRSAERRAPSAARRPARGGLTRAHAPMPAGPVRHRRQLSLVSLLELHVGWLGHQRQ